MQLDLMRLFVDVADSGSFSRAAIERGKAQSGVSRQISQLERECGAALFQRTGRGVVLTDAGQRILPRVRAWLAASDALDADIKASSGHVCGVVRLGVLPPAAHPLATEVFRRTRSEHPGIRLRITEPGSQLDAWMDSGRLDIAVLFRYRALASNERALAVTDTYLVSAPGAEQTCNATVEFARLAGLPLCLPARQSGLRDSVEDIARRKRLPLNIAVEANSLAFQQGAVLEGLCFSLMSPYSCMREVRAGRMQAARVVQPRIRRTLALVTSTHGPLSLACRTVMRLIEEIFARDQHRWMPPIG
ncbi:MAG: LysR family transcriptional regulator [Steroidobacteraceae bacterium]